MKTLPPLVHVKDLVVTFDGFVAVKSIAFDVAPGEVVGLLGGNGAGKSTTMKVISGLLRPQEGVVDVDGKSLRNVHEEEAAKKVIGYCPDVGGLVVGATPREHVQLLLSLRGTYADDYSRALRLLNDIGLGEFIDVPVGGFSHGMSRRLSVALATLASEKLLVLDEPFDGVDPTGVEAIEHIIAAAKSQGLAVIISTHLQSILTRCTDKILVMKSGKILSTQRARTLQGARGEKKYKKMLERASS